MVTEFESLFALQKIREQHFRACAKTVLNLAMIALAIGQRSL